MVKIRRGQKSRESMTEKEWQAHDLMQWVLFGYKIPGLTSGSFFGSRGSKNYGYQSVALR